MSGKLPVLAFDISRRLGAALQGQSVLVACSGGLDSIALLDVLVRLAPRLNMTLATAHIHHGFSDDPSTLDARNRAHAFVRSVSAAYGVAFHSCQASSEMRLHSESDMRNFRLTSFEQICSNESGERIFKRVAIAHHADDLLETRLMRLIRGTGPQGLRAMREISEKVVRPFLRYRRQQIIEYAQSNRLDWLEDPTNQDVRFFRNWLRREWIPLLEHRRAGSSNALARSLDLLTDAVSHDEVESEAGIETSARLACADFRTLSRTGQTARLAAIARNLGIRDFTQSRMIETLKRLDRLKAPGPGFDTFIVGQIEWRVTPLEIEAVRIKHGFSLSSG